MPILNYTTSIDPMKSVAEIQRMLGRHGARRVTVEYEGGAPIGLSFSIETADGPRGFRLPAKVDGVLQALRKGKGKVSRSMVNRTHASRVAWRILKDWIQVQLALVDAELVDVEEVLLPYMLDRSGATFYEAWKDDRLSLPSPARGRDGSEN